MRPSICKRPSSNIMLRIPSYNLPIRNPNQRMRDHTTIQLHNLLPYLIMPKLRQQMDPDIIVNATSSENRNSNSTVCGIPETDIASVAACGWWVPGHNHQVDVCYYGERYCDCPGVEAGCREVGSLAAPAEDEESDCKGEVEGVCRIDCEIDD